MNTVCLDFCLSVAHLNIQFVQKKDSEYFASGWWQLAFDEFRRCVQRCTLYIFMDEILTISVCGLNVALNLVDDLHYFKTEVNHKYLQICKVSVNLTEAAPFPSDVPLAAEILKFVQPYINKAYVTLSTSCTKEVSEEHHTFADVVFGNLPTFAIKQIDVTPRFWGDVGEKFKERVLEDSKVIFVKDVSKEEVEQPLFM